MSKTCLVAAAYSVSPTSQKWDPTVESTYYQLLKSLPEMQGLEHPFLGSLHQFDDNWFLQNIDPAWKIILTCVPGVMGNLSNDANFGIASDDQAGREKALNFYREACKAIKKLNSHFNKQMVPCVQIHSSPSRKNAFASKSSLISSLVEMQSWDWSGAKLVIEHCDAYSSTKESAKGFLTLQEEIDAVTEVNAETNSDIGFCVNWGRSAIETNSVNGPIEHISKLTKLNLLTGLMFSGAAAQDEIYGNWRDTHIPPRLDDSTGHYDLSNSLLTENEIRRCINACEVDKLSFLGVKISLLPRTNSPEICAKYNAASLDLVVKSIP